MNPPVVLLAIVLFIALGALLWQAYARRREKALFELQQRRYADLKRELLTIGQPVAIRGASGIFATAMAIAIAAVTAWVWTLEHQGVFLAVAVLCAVLALLGLAQSVPKLGRPLIFLSRQEIDIAGFGPLPWSAIEGIELAEVRHYSSVVAYRLRFYVPYLPQRLESAHPWVRLLHRLTAGRRMARIASVRLRATSEAPATIERLCRDLWKAATGRDHPWSIHYSNAQLEIMRDLRKMRDNDPLRDPETELAGLRRLSAKIDREFTEHSLQMRVRNTGAGAVAAILVLVVAQQIAHPLTHFVGSSQWLMISLAIAILLGLLGVALVVRHLRAGDGAKLRGSSLAGVVVALLVGFMVCVVFAWLLLQESIGDPIARSAGEQAVITVTAKKTDEYRRRGCTRRLDGHEVGNEICLSREEFARLPDEVQVRLRVRRHWIGYHVDSQQILLPD